MTINSKIFAVISWSSGWVNWCWISMAKCSAPKNGYLREKKIWALYGKMNELVLKEMTLQKVKLGRSSALKNGYLSEKKIWALYRRMTELVLNPKEGWLRIKWISISRCSALKNAHLRQRKIWTIYRWVSWCWVQKKDGAE